jgi:hypothetical protein
MATNLNDEYERHARGLTDGSVTAVGKPFGLMFGGQRNFGGLGPDCGTIFSFGVRLSDGWESQFHTREEAEAFVAEHPPKAVAA